MKKFFRVLVLVIFVICFVAGCSLISKKSSLISKKRDLINIVFFKDLTSRDSSLNFPAPNKTWNYNCWDKNSLQRANELTNLIDDRVVELGLLGIPLITKFSFKYCVGDIGGKRIIGIFFLKLKEKGLRGPGYYGDGDFYIWFYFDLLESKRAQEKLITKCAKVIYKYFSTLKEEE